jgi:hypothetical protein
MNETKQRKLERAGWTVDLLLRSLLVLGASPRDIAHSISRSRRKRRVAAGRIP